MKKDKLVEYICSVCLCVILFFNLFVLDIFSNKIIFAGFLLVYLIVLLAFVKGKKVSNKDKKKVAILMAAFAGLHILFLYIVGIFAGFYKNSISFSVSELFNRILPISVIIIISELIRWIFVTKEDRKLPIVATIGLILVDISLYINLYNKFDLEEVLALVGYVGLASISTNLLCNYTVKRYGFLPNMLYRIVTTMYIYVLPILPDIYLFFQSVFRIIYPYVIYLMLDFAFTNEEFKVALKSQKTSVVTIVLGIIIAFSMVLLVSCEFKYGIMVVGSSSMAGSVDKGDAVVFERYDGQTLKEGQIIIFNKDDVQTIHRIEDIQVLNGNTIYYTKGDNNEQKDEGYRTDKDILGVVKFKVVYIGWPTIWLKDMFSN